MRRGRATIVAVEKQ